MSDKKELKIRVPQDLYQRLGTVKYIVQDHGSLNSFICNALEEWLRISPQTKEWRKAADAYKAQQAKDSKK